MNSYHHLVEVYIRPLFSATLGLRNAHLILYGLCTGRKLFKGSKIPCISVEITHEFHRASSKGVGSAKTIGNYASSFIH